MNTDPIRQNIPSPQGNDKPGGGSQKAGRQEGKKIPGDANNTLPEEVPAEK